jgi:hypothetical protein
MQKLNTELLKKYKTKTKNKLKIILEELVFMLVMGLFTYICIIIFLIYY